MPLVNTVSTILQHYFGYEVPITTKLKDLHMDSLDKLELIFDIEQQTNIKVEEEALQAFAQDDITVAEFINKINSQES